ncbi:MAG: FAD-dependent oxidoreductase [Anaerolineae bacterium]
MRTIDGSAVLILGESVAGVVAAVRAAREGLDTILVTYKDNLGGVFPSLGAFETHYQGCRAPLLEELKDRVIEYYRSTYGVRSEQYHACLRFESDKPFVTFEPHVMTKILANLVLAEPKLRIFKCYYPISVELARDRLLGITLQSFSGNEQRQIRADIFADATYEGDLAATARVPYRIGRESRREYDEPHAGRLFTRFWPGNYPHDAVIGRLKLLPKRSTMGLMAGSTGEGDDNIQDYSYRLCLSCDPHNRRLPEKPDGYERANFLGIVEDPETTAFKRYALHYRFITQEIHEMMTQDHLFHGMALPNHKRSWNATNFTGAGKEYPDGDWSKREQIARSHVNHALGILFFLQNDEAVPEDVRQQAREWGLALDEFVDTGNIPPQMYIREARRIKGRYIFTENDVLLAHGLDRAPIHADSVAITEFPLDSLPCTTERRPGTLCDGQFPLMEATRPGQVPYGILLPEDIQNLLVLGTPSVTHVAWGTIRQEPTLIHLGEVVGYAASLAMRRSTTPGELPVEILQQELVENKVMISFFNDFDMSVEEPWVPAVQYLGTKGFFASYDALPWNLLSLDTARAWAHGAVEMLAGVKVDPVERARQLPHDSMATANAVSATQLSELLISELKKRDGGGIDLASLLDCCDVGQDQVLTRGTACQILYTLLRKASK